MSAQTVPPGSVRTGHDLVASMVTSDDHLSARGDELAIEGCLATDLARSFGTPLYVYSEATLRDNLRRIAAVHADSWPGRTRVLYAIKANNHLAIRALLAAEGVGGDCYGAGELHATLAAGTDPALTVLNGSTKSDEELATAIGAGVMVNLDSMGEIDQVLRICNELGGVARVSLRLRPDDAWAEGLSGDFYADPERASVAQTLKGNKWGFSVTRAHEAIGIVRMAPAVDLVGYHLHVGRLSRDPEVFARWAGALGTMTIDLHERSGFWPQVLNIGGGWPRQRDVESNAHGPFGGPPLSVYFAAVSEALVERLSTVDEPVPELWIEPGRYLVGNAGILLTAVTTIKQDLDRTWVNVDASTNLLMRVEMQGVQYPIVPTAGLDRPLDVIADVVGPSCLQSILRSGYGLPTVDCGEILAVLDAGMYAEVHANQFNGLPRPAAVLVNGDEAEVIKVRERVEDLFANHRIPDRLAPLSRQ